jgi:kumamolisin
LGITSERDRIPLAGSEKEAVSGAKEIGEVDPNERFEVTIVLRPKSFGNRSSPEPTTPLQLKKRKYLSREEFAAVQGADVGDFQKIREFASENGLVVSQIDPSRRSITLSGNTAGFSQAFGVELKRYEHPEQGGVTFRGRTGPLFIPSYLAEIVLAVLGLDNRPQAAPRIRPIRPEQLAITSYSPPEVAKLYDFPNGPDGTGECIGIVELGGGSNQADLTTYFQGLSVRVPKLVTISVDGGTNSPTGDPNGPDGEVMLDIEVAGSIAPGAVIAVYFAPNTDRGFVDALTTAVNDAQNKPSVISISWGSAENTWTAQAIQSFNQALQDASTMGVTVCCASGDGGSTDGQTDGLVHVDFPASSPFALGCGGTQLVSSKGVITSEVVWNNGSAGGATGGGISDVFPLPDWQKGFKVPASSNPGGRIGRGVPDVAGDADPSTGYTVRVDGQSQTYGGTSAVAPLWSGLIALMNQKLGHSIGFINPILYGNYSSKLSGDFRDITSGNNGAYSAAAGWDPCTGLGSPDGAKLIKSVLALP